MLVQLNNRRLSIQALFAVTLLTLVGIPMKSVADIPGFNDLELSPTTARDLLERKTLVFQYPEANHTIRSENWSFRYLTNLIVIDASSEAVKEAVTNYSRYDNYFSNLHTAEIQSSSGTETTVTFSETLKFAVIEPTVTYTLTFSEVGNNEIVFTRKSGDFQLYRGRWEFVPLSENRTLLALTSRMNFSDVSWRGDMVLWAQPDLKRTLPVVRGTGFVRTFRKIIEDSDSEVPDTVPEEPTIPKNLNDTDTYRPLKSLSKKGTTIFVHPEQYVSLSGKPKRLVFITTIDLVDGPIDRSRHYLTRFEKVPQFIDQLSSVQAKKTENGFIAEWYFNMGFYLFSVPVEYKVRYTWEHEYRLTYERISGDLNPIYGSYEWASVNDNQTLYAFTSASRLGKDASSMIKLGRSLRHPQIFMGLSLGAVGVENGVKWTNKQIRKENTSN